MTQILTTSHDYSSYDYRRTVSRRAEEARAAHKATARRIDAMLARLAAPADCECDALADCQSAD